MALSGISNTATGINQASPQKPANSTEQTEERKSALSSDGGFSGNSLNDKVTLSQTGDNGAAAVELDAQAVDKILPKTKEAILQEPKTALAMQANSSSQTALEFLADK